MIVIQLEWIEYSFLFLLSLELWTLTQSLKWVHSGLRDAVAQPPPHSVLYQLRNRIGKREDGDFKQTALELMEVLKNSSVVWNNYLGKWSESGKN